MTNKQYNLAFATQEELKELVPGCDVKVTFNYYTKLPEFIVLMERGAWHFSMFKRDRYEQTTNEYGVTYNHYTGEKYALLQATFDPTTRDEKNGMIVSGAHNIFELPKSSFSEELPRVNFAKYVEFTKRILAKEPVSV